MSDSPALQALAARLDRYSRHVALGVIPLVAIAVVDLVTNSLTDDHRIDYVLLAAAAMCVYSAYLQRRLAPRLRTGTLPQRTKRTAWLRALLSIGVCFAISAGFGYVLGGWIVAVILPSVSAAILAGATAVGLRRRKRARTNNQAGRDRNAPAR